MVASETIEWPISRSFAVTWAVSLVVSVLISGVLTWWVRNLAVAHRWVKGPASPRHIHSRPIPRIGGVAIYASFLLAFVVLAAAARFERLQTDLGPWTRTLGPLLIPATLLFLIGLLDDLRGLNAWGKLFFQIVAGLLLYDLGFRVVGFEQYLDHIPGQWILLPVLTVSWVIFVVNAINLLDGLDGLAAGSGLLSTLVIALVAMVFGSPAVAMAAIILAGTVLGFLRFNFNPASIFLGDSGSLFLGFMLAGLSLAGVQAKMATAFAVAIPVVACGLPLTELMTSVLRRLLSGQPLFSPDREHIHHRLLDLGLTHRQVVVLLYAASLVFAGCSLLLLRNAESSVALVIVVIGSVVFLGIQHLGYPEFKEFGRIAVRTLEQRQVMANNIALRKAAARLEDALDVHEVGAILVKTFCGPVFDGYTLELTSLVAPPENTFPLHLVICDAEFAARVSLPLCSSSGLHLGVLHVYRGVRAESLLLDVNLLSSEFVPALTTALLRLSAVSEAERTKGRATHRNSPERPRLGQFEERT